MNPHNWQPLGLEAHMCTACGFITDDKLQVNCRGKRLPDKDYIDAANDPEDLYD